MYSIYSSRSCCQAQLHAVAKHNLSLPSLLPSLCLCCWDEVPDGQQCTFTFPISQLHSPSLSNSNSCCLIRHHAWQTCSNIFCDLASFHRCTEAVNHVQCYSPDPCFCSAAATGTTLAAAAVPAHEHMCHQLWRSDGRQVARMLQHYPACDTRCSLSSLCLEAWMIWQLSDRRLV